MVVYQVDDMFLARVTNLFTQECVRDGNSTGDWFTPPLYEKGDAVSGNSGVGP